MTYPPAAMIRWATLKFLFLAPLYALVNLPLCEGALSALLVPWLDALLEHHVIDNTLIKRT